MVKRVKFGLTICSLIICFNIFCVYRRTGGLEGQRHLFFQIADVYRRTGGLEEI